MRCSTYVRIHDGDNDVDREVKRIPHDIIARQNIVLPSAAERHRYTLNCRYRAGSAYDRNSDLMLLAAGKARMV